MTRHLSVSIKGLEDRLYGRVSKKYGTWQIFEDENGRLLTKQEVIADIERHKKLGHEVIAACDFIDEKGHCKGHPDSPLPEKEEE